MSRRFKICLIVWIAVVAASALSKQANAQGLEIGTTAAPAPIAVPNAPLVVNPDAPAVLTPEAVPAGEIQTVQEEWVINIQPALKIDPAAFANVVEGTQCENCERRGPVVDPALYAKVYASIPFNRAEYRANPTYRHDATMEILTGNARHKTVVHHGTRPTVQQPAPTYPAIYPATFIRPGIRLNYYRYFPSLSPYLSWWNFNGVF